MDRMNWIEVAIIIAILAIIGSIIINAFVSPSCEERLMPRARTYADSLQVSIACETKTKYVPVTVPIYIPR